MNQDLLIELGTEELPPKTLKQLSASFHQSITDGLRQLGVPFASSEQYATPRRLAVIIKGLAPQQPDREEEKLGPAVAAAFDKDGNPSKAAEGFARSNNTSFDQLLRVNTDKGERLAFISKIQGLPTTELLPQVIENALAALPIAKRMRWGASRAEFVRPVKWLVIKFGAESVDATILGVRSSNKSYGHRFHAPEAFEVDAANYQEELAKRYVIADFNQRRELILSKVTALADKHQGKAIIPDDLLDEVTALVEWPVPLVCCFEERFLEVPQEALISTMQDNQKYFCLVDANGKLMSRFITVSNIESRQPSLVVMGNEKVVRPRLTDAEFFFAQDKKQSLDDYRARLKTVVFQNQLGTVFAKTERISKLAAYIAKQIGANSSHAERAGQLAKADLVTNMVLEFTELQGLMGYYYALNDGEAEDVAIAIRDQYFPAGNNDRMPANAVASALALADRIDTLIGIFGIGQQPTGTKDPFALRRATLGIIRIILSAKLDLDLRDLYQFAFAQFTGLAEDTVQQALDYTFERFRAIYHEQGFATEVYLAVAAKQVTKPVDFDQRAKAVYQFMQLSEAEAVSSANKRISNILAKQGKVDTTLDASLLKDEAEKALVLALAQKREILQAAAKAAQYAEFLQTLASLKPEVDAFFEQVMVMVDDAAVRNNRLALLTQLNQQFSHVADIALLASK